MLKKCPQGLQSCGSRVEPKLGQGCGVGVSFWPVA